MKQTTALRKIASLDKKIRVIQGGQGAGKTIAILILLINHASGSAGKEIIIASAELTKMRLTVIKDFVKVMKSFGIYNEHRFIAGTLYRFPNGSFVKFVGLDKEDVGKGFRGDVFYLNEGDKVGFETYREIASRFKNIYIDFNPNARFWVHDEVVKRRDCDFITLTYKDNEYLDQGEIDEINYYYERGYNEDGTEKSRYWANKWRVYGLGEIGILEGAVFEDWDKVPVIPEEAKLLGYGLDFGYVAPSALIAVYKLDDKYYLDEVIYEDKLSNQDIAEMMEALEIGREIIYADYAEPKSIEEIRRYGINIHPCESKVDIRPFGIKKLNNDTFYVTESSTNLINELLTLIWDVDKKGIHTGKPRKGNDHACDAIIYFIGTEGKYDGTYR